MTAGRYEKVAKRYARALFSACEPTDFDRVERQLKELSAAWDCSQDLRQSMLNPQVGDATRQAIVEAVVGSLGGWANDVTKRAVLTLVELRKAATLPALAEIFARLVSEYRKSLALEITLAKPASADMTTQIKERLTRALGGDVSVTIKQDPSIIGGATIRMGDTLLDRSVAGALQRISSQLA
ncbi:MAG: ATP synthase F1 subunit delta [Pseudomonadota bacterium]|jgi:F-type H+-transporting ATPase subunit delta